MTVCYSCMTWVNNKERHYAINNEPAFLAAYHSVLYRADTGQLHLAAKEKYRISAARRVFLYVGAFRGNCYSGGALGKVP